MATTEETKLTLDPVAHDTKIARLCHDLAQAQQKERYAEQRIIRGAGVKVHRFGKETKRGWGSEDEYFTLEEALDLCNDAELLGALDLQQTITVTRENEIFHLEAAYEGWSRFFLVTSSQGHIHSSMKCSTCFNTTTYGWLPELSGKTEAEAVETHGPALCSVCFPSAPVENTGYKITQSRAQELAWSPDRQEKIAAREAREIAKAEAKLKKAASKLKYDESLAHKVNKLIDLNLNDNAAYEWTWDHKGFDNAYYVYKDIRTKR